MRALERCSFLIYADIYLGSRIVGVECGLTAGRVQLLSSKLLLIKLRVFPSGKADYEEPEIL